MARNRQPILKRCRTLGLAQSDLGYSKTSIKKAKITRKKPSEYSIQLKEKQKVKFIYGVLEKQFHHYYEVAEKAKGMTGANMLVMLERRLDNVVYRVGLGATRKQARQFVNHGLITVNGKRLNIPSYQIQVGDVIGVKESKAEQPLFVAVKQSKLVPNLPKWLEFNPETLTGKVTALPTREDIDATIQEHMIVEFYSK